MTRCPGCGTEKADEDFYRNRSSRSGLSNYCKKCTRIKNQLWVQANLEKIKKWHAEYYQTHKLNYKMRSRAYALTEKDKNRRRAYRVRNIEKVRIWGRIYRAKHLEKTRTQRSAYYKRHREQLRIKAKLKRSKDRDRTGNWYINQLMNQALSSKGVKFPDELINLYRAQIMLQRKAKSLQEALNGSGCVGKS